jgi:hypothetical protein
VDNLALCVDNQFILEFPALGDVEKTGVLLGFLDFFFLGG